MDASDWSAAWRNVRAWLLDRFHEGELLDLWMGANVETWRGLGTYAREERSGDNDRLRRKNSEG